MKKLTIAVLYGGKTGEHAVSLVSAASVIRHLDRTQYDIVPIGIDQAGNWYQTPLASIDPLAGKNLLVKHDDSIPFTPFAFPADVVFPVLHGTYGEDGTIQGLLEVANIAYVGSGVCASAVALDKDISKQLAKQAGIPTLAHLCFRAARWGQAAEQVVNDIEQKFAYPVFVKPANTGSSVAVNKAKNRQQLHQAIQEAFAYDEKLIVEPAVSIRELEVAVLENPDYGQAPLTSVVGEITTTHEFYSYQAKYHDDDALQLHIPAQISPAIRDELQQLAARVFDVLGCQGMARADFFLDREKNALIFNEVNTIPGFTHVSMYPLLWQKSGVFYSDLLDRLIKLAIAKYKRKVSFTATNTAV